MFHAIGYVTTGLRLIFSVGRSWRCGSLGRYQRLRPRSSESPCPSYHCREQNHPGSSTLARGCASPTGCRWWPAVDHGTVNISVDSRQHTVLLDSIISCLFSASCSFCFYYFPRVRGVSLLRCHLRLRSFVRRSRFPCVHCTTIAVLRS